MSTLSTSRRRSKLLRLDLLSNHAICGCDSVSVLFGKGKKTMLHKVKSLRNISYTEAFINTDNKKEDSGSWRKVLDHVVLGAQFYGRAIRNSKLSSEFRLQTLPLTTLAAQQHSFRTYHTHTAVMEWKQPASY